MNQSVNVQLQFSKLVSMNSVALNTTLADCHSRFQLIYNIFTNVAIACLAPSLGQQVETGSHDSSAQLEITCIMHTELHIELEPTAKPREPKVRFPLGDFVRANRQKSRNSPSCLRRIFSLANFNQSRCWILVFALRRANKIAKWKTGFIVRSSHIRTRPHIREALKNGSALIESGRVLGVMGVAH